MKINSFLMLLISCFAFTTVAESRRAGPAFFWNKRHGMMETLIPVGFESSIINENVAPSVEFKEILITGKIQDISPFLDLDATTVVIKDCTLIDLESFSFLFNDAFLNRSKVTNIVLDNITDGFGRKFKADTSMGGHLAEALRAHFTNANVLVIH